MRPVVLRGIRRATKIVAGLAHFFCSTCELWKTPDQFHRWRARRGQFRTACGRLSQCRKCNNAARVRRARRARAKRRKGVTPWRGGN